MYYYDPTIILIIIGFVLGVIAQGLVERSYKKYARVPSQGGRTGAQVARALLDESGLSDVQIERIGGNLSDHYDPAHRVLRLSSGVHDSASIAAVGVAAHETGHALQHRDAYGPLMLRNVAVPLVNFGSTLSWPLFIVGMFSGFEPLIWVGILLFSLAVLFSLVTLPVELNASSRAVYALESGGYITGGEVSGVKSVLRSAAMTYVASAIASILSLLRLLMISGVGRRRD